MSDTLDNAIIELLSKVTQGAESTGDFILSELPSFVNELLTWYAVYSLSYAFINLIFTLIAIFLFIRCDLVDSIDKALAKISFCVIGLICFFIFVDFTMDAVKILVAPKLWLIEYAASLVK